MIVGGGRRDAVEVRRTERYAFGHGAGTQRSVDGRRRSRVRSRCPTSLLGPCTVDYRVIVPDNVALDVRTTGGNVVAARLPRLGARSRPTRGAIDIAGYCGNSLDARAGAGDIALDAACAPPQLSLRSGSRRRSARCCPPGRYDIDAESTSGERARPRRSTARDDAPYVVQVLSGSGDVAVEGRS